MRLLIEHHTTYSFTEPQTRLVQMLRMAPRDTLNQTIVDWRIDVNRDARLRAAADGFGNEVTMLYAEGPLDSIEITVVGEALCTEGSGVLEGLEETLSPLVYRRTTIDTAPGEHSHAFVERLGGEDDAQLDRLWALCRAIGDSFPNRVRKTPISKAEEMFAASSQSARDLSQMFVTCSRVLGIPARYVSGYALAAAEREGSPGPHGWAEAFVDGLGWVGFDPSEQKSPDDTYVRVAIGLDAAGAAPISGARTGQGQEALDVDVHIDRLGGSSEA